MDYMARLYTSIRACKMSRETVCVPKSLMKCKCTTNSPPVVTYATVPGVTTTPSPSFPALDSVIIGYTPGPSEETTAYPS